MPRKMAKNKEKDSFLGSSDSESDTDNEGAGQGQPEGSGSGLAVNQKYASKFEAEARFKDMQRNKELLADGLIAGSDDDSDETDEDDDAELLTASMDVQIMRTINSLRTKDPKIYDSNHKFFEHRTDDSDSDSDSSSAANSGDDETTRNTKANKRATYKDVIRQQLADGGADLNAEDDVHIGLAPHERKSLAYDPEQEQIRRAFLKSTETEGDDSDSDEEGEGMLRVKSHAEPIEEDEDEEAAAAELAVETKRMVELGRQQQQQQEEEWEVSSSKKKKKKKVKTEASSSSSAAYGSGEAESEPVVDGDLFLANFIISQAWKQDPAMVVQRQGIEHAYNEREFLENDVETEENELDEVDRFESKYNFRFEEAGDSASFVGLAGDASASASGASGSGADILAANRSLAQVSTHSRNVEGSLRREDDRRKKSREEKAEKKAKEKRQRAEELKRLKNLKRKELQERVKKIASVSGSSLEAVGIDPAMLDDEWDPEKHEAMMQEQYGDDYYGDDDRDAEGNLVHPFQSAKDEEMDAFIDGGIYAEYDRDNGEDSDEGEDGEQYDGVGDEADETYNEEIEAYAPLPSKEFLEKNRKLATGMLEELYALDYEDTIGDLKCRFKYKSVEADSYGLNASEIILADDAELNKYVGLRKISAYADDGYGTGTGSGMKSEGSEFAMSKKRKRFRATLRDRLQEEQRAAAEKGRTMKKEALTTSVMVNRDRDEQEEQEQAREEQEQEQAGEEQGQAAAGGEEKKKRKRRKSKASEEVQVLTKDSASADVAAASNSSRAEKAQKAALKEAKRAKKAEKAERKQKALDSLDPEEEARKAAKKAAKQRMTLYT